jgi:hypothetical protein
MVAWDRVTRRDVLRAIHDYDRLGPEQFFSEHGFAPTTTYELVWDKHRRKSARQTRIQHREKAKEVKETRK